MFSIAHSVDFTIFQANFNIFMRIAFYFHREEKNSSKQLKYEILLARSPARSICLYLSIYVSIQLIFAHTQNTIG